MTDLYDAARDGETTLTTLEETNEAHGARIGRWLLLALGVLLVWVVFLTGVIIGWLVLRLVW